MTSIFGTLMLAIIPATTLAQDLTDQTSENVDLWTFDRNGTERAPLDKPPERLEREAESFRTYSRDCDAGQVVSCGLLGEAYELGIGAPQNRPIAQILYTEACREGDGESCYRLGRLSLAREDQEGGPDAAVLFERACTMGSADGCTSFARMIPFGGVAQGGGGQREAILRQTCQRTDGPACADLASLLLDTRPEGTWQGEAFALINNRCGKGDVYACETLIANLEREEVRGLGLSEVELLHQGCNNGSASACKTLGDRALLGEGMGQDRDYAFIAYDRSCTLNSFDCRLVEDMRALPSFVEACESGVLAACKNAADVYSDASTVYWDNQIAERYYVRACEGDVLSACVNAAGFLLSRSADPTSIEAASGKAFLDKACSGGELSACHSLAMALSNGTQLPKDIARANGLYARLCEADYARACQALERYAIIEPDAPLAIAGSNYLPPFDPDNPEGPMAEILEERQRALNEACASSTVEFRGFTYSDTVCNAIERVIGGIGLRPGQAPWQALLWRPERLPGNPGTLEPAYRVLCGGSLIGRGWILTAAHCLRDQERSIEGLGYEVRLGVHNPRQNEGVSYPIIELHEHPLFDPGTYAFDIALVRYDPGAGRSGDKTNAISRIAVDAKSMTDRQISLGMPVYTYGWGWTAASGAGSISSEELRGAKLELFDQRECTRITDFRRGARRNSMLCAAGIDASGAQACQGDSGGPLITYSDPDRRPRVIGVVSSGRSCGRTGEPSRYTRVAAARSWIDEVLSGRR